MPDPLAAVWEPPPLPILERDPATLAVTPPRHLQMIDPDSFPDDRVRRTLERRVRDWRALHGAPRDVIFRQVPEPGRMALSDFTDGEEGQRAFQWKDRPTNEIGVTIAGAPFPHRLFHFVLAYSGWEHVVRRRARTRGASPAHRAGRRKLHRARREPPRHALWNLGGVSREHRADSFSAAYRNLDAEAAEDV
ncbi:hypothetical protein FJM51_23340, partial [Amaricoccus solimangrovi]